MRSIQTLKAEFRALGLNYDTMNFDRLEALLRSKFPYDTITKAGKLHDNYEKQYLANLALNALPTGIIMKPSLERAQMTHDEIATQQLKNRSMFGGASRNMGVAATATPVVPAVIAATR